jgi:hypothetical protein
MPVGKRPPRPALQLPLESSRLFPPPKRKVSLNDPGNKLGCMPNPAPVMLPQPRHQIPRHPRVPLPRTRLTPQKINIKQSQPPLQEEANPPHQQPGPTTQPLNNQSNKKGNPAEARRAHKLATQPKPKGQSKGLPAEAQRAKAGGGNDDLPQNSLKARAPRNPLIINAEVISHNHFPTTRPEKRSSPPISRHRTRVTGLQ